MWCHKVMGHTGPELCAEATQFVNKAGRIDYSHVMFRVPVPELLADQPPSRIR